MNSVQTESADFLMKNENIEGSSLLDFHTLFASQPSVSIYFQREIKTEFVDESSGALNQVRKQTCHHYVFTLLNLFDESTV